MKLDKSSVNNVLFVVLLVFVFEFGLACLSSVSAILFISFRTTFYEYASVVVIFTLSLFLFVILYKCLVSAKRRNLLLLLLSVGLTVLSFWLNNVTVHKMIHLDEAFLYRYIDYKDWTSTLRYVGKYVLVLLLLVVRW